MTRQFVAYRREERGFGTNPWSTHNRFIISHALLPSTATHCCSISAARARKGLLIVDEAHITSPRRPAGTRPTRTPRGPSGTSRRGSTTASFCRRRRTTATATASAPSSISSIHGVYARGAGRGEERPRCRDGPAPEARPSRARVERFPRRLLVRLSLTNTAGGTWHTEETGYDAETGKRARRSRGSGRGEPVGLSSPKSSSGTRTLRPASADGKFPLIILQQRLLSSPEAFAHTLEKHAQAVMKQGGAKAAPEQGKLALEKPSPRKAVVGDDVDPETYGQSEEAEGEEVDARVRQTSGRCSRARPEARQLLSDMRALADKSRRAPDAKVLALLAWMRENQCPAVGLGEGSKASSKWSPRRVIIFTEYGDTKRYCSRPSRLRRRLYARWRAAHPPVPRWHGG